MSDLPAFVSYPLDRADELRGDAEALAALRRAPQTRIALFWRLRPLVRAATDGALAPACDEGAALLGAHAEADPKRPEIFLGRDAEGRAVFAAALDPALEPAEADAARPVRFQELREAAAVLDAGAGSLLATARSILAWHETHSFCARCGSQSASTYGGWRRVCSVCLEEHYPRVSPVVIMVIARGGKILLGRQPSWPANAYSCLAGFVEPGETPEQAARREAFEESGVVLGDVQYLMAQPWPFPSQLMIGMRAEALTDEIRIDPSEIADARWFSRAEVADMMAGRSAVARTPFPAAVAHHLIRWWLEQG